MAKRGNKKSSGNNKKTANRSKTENKSTNKVEIRQKEPFLDDSNIIESVSSKIDEAENTMNERGVQSSVDNNINDIENQHIEKFKERGDIHEISEYLEKLYSRYNDLYKDADEKQKSAEIKESEISIAFENAKTQEANATTLVNDAKKEAESIIKEANIKRDEYIKKLREVSEMLDAGKYSNEVDSFLKMIVDGQLDLFEKAKQTIKNVRDNAEAYTNQVVESTNIDEEAFNILARESKVKAQEEKIRKRLSKLTEIDNEQRNDIESEIRREYTERLSEKEKEIESLKFDKQFEQKEKLQLQEELDKIRLAFKDRDPEEMARLFIKLSRELAEVKDERNNMYSESEVESYKKQIEYYEGINIERKRDEAKAELLKTELDTTAPRIFASKVDELKMKIETLEHVNNVLNENLESQRKSIETLSQKKNDVTSAFECAHRYDEGDYQFDYSDFDDKTHKNELKSLKELALYIQKRLASLEKPDKPVYYELETIRLFIAGLHMSNITILQGISGTGKTSLAREFVKALTVGSPTFCGQNEFCEEKAPYRICSVQSGWRDNMDLMGFYNVFQNKYNETEIFKGLYLANTPLYKNTLYFIILDEMNLSHPEHYFADFLSLLEHPSIEQHKIILKDVPENNPLKHLVGSKLQVPKNVRFIGTANHDETTLGFAPKTLDRSNVMDIPAVDTDDLGKKILGDRMLKTDEKHTVSFEWIEEEFEKADNNYKEECNTFYKFVKKNDIIKLLFEEQEIVSGSRFDEQASKFICAYIASGSDDEKTRKESLAYAADHLITTRLLRKVRERRFDIDDYKIVEEFKKSFDKEFEEVFKRKPDAFADVLLNEEIKWHKKQKS